MDNLQIYKKKINEIKAHITSTSSKKPEYEHLTALYDLVYYMHEDYPGEKRYILNVTNYIKKWCRARSIDEKHDCLFWDTLLFEAPWNLDSYALFIERDRKPQERFYEPRRKTLKKVVDKLQMLEDDELDELFCHQPGRTGKLLADDTPVFTDKGWKKHGELVAGDKVIGSDWDFTEVVCVHPKYHTTHTITFSDGSQFDCHYRHEWAVFDRDLQEMITIETRDMIPRLKSKDERNNFTITQQFPKNRTLSVEKIEESEPKPGNCITVANLDGIYLIGKEMIPTHNSQIITVGASWHCARDPEKSNLYVTYKEGLGGAFLDGVLEIWTDPTYCFKEVFPKIEIARTDAKNHKVDLNRRKKYATLSGKGLESGLNGEYDAYGWLILDDLLEGIQDVLNPDILKRKQIVFDNNVMSRKKEQCKLILNGTIWSLHDLFMDRRAFLESNPEAKDIRWDVLKIPALDPVTDESNFDYDYGVGFTTKYYRTIRAKFEENGDMAGWFAQYQQEPIERDGAVFSPDNMPNRYDGILPEEEPLKVVAACDVALGGMDYLSMPVAYVYEDGRVYVHDVVYDNSEKKVTQPKVVEMLIENEVRNAFFEANAGGEGYRDDIERLLSEQGIKINLVSKYTQQILVNFGKGGAKTNQRKEQRIWDNAETIRQFYFREPGCQSLEYRKFMNNLYSFTINGKNKNDDAPDSLAMLAVFINKGSGVKPTRIIKSPI